jgi:hypothetical protein
MGTHTKSYAIALEIIEVCDIAHGATRGMVPHHGEVLQLNVLTYFFVWTCFVKPKLDLSRRATSIIMSVLRVIRWKCILLSFQLSYRILFFKTQRCKNFVNGLTFFFSMDDRCKTQRCRTHIDVRSQKLVEKFFYRRHFFYRKISYC